MKLKQLAFALAVSAFAVGAAQAQTFVTSGPNIQQESVAGSNFFLGAGFHQFDVSNLSVAPLQGNEKLTVTYTFLGDEAGFNNRFVEFALGANKFTNNGSTVGDSFSQVFLGSAGPSALLNFGFGVQQGGPLVMNGSNQASEPNFGIRIGQNDVFNVGNQQQSFAATLWFNDTGAGPDVDFDDMVVGVNFNVEIVPVPEPSEWAMMLAGLGMMGVMIRRRRQPLSA